MIVRVQCTIVIDVEYPDDTEHPDFVIEENGCPGTGNVGSAIDRVIEDGEKRGVCWACNLQGENKILAINGVEVDEEYRKRWITP